MPVVVENVSDLPFQGPALRGRRPVTPSPPYLWPSKDQVYSLQLSWLGGPLWRNLPLFSIWHWAQDLEVTVQVLGSISGRGKFYTEIYIGL